MTLRAPLGTFLLVTLVNASAVWAQAPEDAREAVQLKVKRGDSMTVTTIDGRVSRGRFVIEGDDAMVLSVDDREVPLAWADITRVQRRRNGIMLGALIGIAAGAVAAYPVYMISENETGDGAADAVKMVLMGAGAGIGIDALFSRNRTIYRRSGPRATVQVEPRKAGGVLRLAVTW
jgi:hypothetical protein